MSNEFQPTGDGADEVWPPDVTSDDAAVQPSEAWDGQSEAAPRADDEDRTVPTPPETGDADIDGALEDLARAQGEPLSERISAGEQALDVLQSRLRDLGGA